MATIIGKSITALAATALVISSAAPALAATQISDLDGMRASSLDSELEGRGFSQHSSSPSGQGVYTYWWKASDKTCARVYTADGRVAGTKLVSASDCGQKSGDAGAVAAVAAAALIGALALSSKSHNRNDQYGDNARQLADFDRGHRDGLYNQSYHNYGNSQAYKDGYNSGVQEHDQQTRYRGGKKGYGGYSQFVELSDLSYQDSSWAFGQLGQRGFRRTGGYTSDGGRSENAMYYNSGSHQCVNVSARDGKIQSVESINEGNCQ